MSLIKQWIINQERKMDDDLMFFDADRYYEIQQAMQETMDEPPMEASNESPTN